MARRPAQAPYHTLALWATSSLPSRDTAAAYTQNMSNFADEYNSLPLPIQHVLRRYDIEPLRTDAQLYTELYQEHGGPQTWAQEAHKADPEQITVESATAALDILFYRANRFVSRRTETSLKLDLELDRRDALVASEISFTDQDTKRATANWKHWRPSNQDLPSTTKRQIEITLRTNWINRLLDTLIPYAANIPYMVKYAGKDERLKWRALFGNTRWGTIKHHSLVLIKTLKQQHKSPIPWDDGKITSMILYYKSTSRTANQLRNFWGTVKYLCKTFGCPSPGDKNDILSI